MSKSRTLMDALAALPEDQRDAGCHIAALAAGLAWGNAQRELNAFLADVLRVPKEFGLGESALPDTLYGNTEELARITREGLAVYLVEGQVDKDQAMTIAKAAATRITEKG